MEHPLADELSGCRSVEVAAEPPGKAPFKCIFAQRTIFGCRYMKEVFIKERLIQ
jgi:hypothetical protein